MPQKLFHQWIMKELKIPLKYSQLGLFQSSKLKFIELEMNVMVAESEKQSIFKVNYFLWPNKGSLRFSVTREKLNP